MFMICRLDVEFSLSNLSLLIVVPTFLHLSILISSVFELYSFIFSAQELVTKS